MKLQKFLQINEITQEEFASKVGVSRPWITYIVNEVRNPSIGLSMRIEEATNGQVTIKDLFNPKAPSRLKDKTPEKVKD